MEERKVEAGCLEEYSRYLFSDEKSEATIEKYMRDLRSFVFFVSGRAVSKELLIEYKKALAERYSLVSANSMIAAVNSFLRFMGWPDCCVKQYKVQRRMFYPEDKELTKAEYFRLVKAARDRCNERLCLILQTICGTGMRVSELRYLTVEAVRRGEAVVACKGKRRVIFIVPELKRVLLQYAKKQGISSGMIFVTRTGKAVSRCNIWRDMKALCLQANVNPKKVFPHNLRHLFARTFYGLEKDIAKLADILGHTNIETTRIYIMTTGVEHKRKMTNMRLLL